MEALPAGDEKQVGIRSSFDFVFNLKWRLGDTRR
eukprot:COSAG01_NODE_14462_length_1451_cov_1.173817_1_plen_33_part_10